MVNAILVDRATSEDAEDHVIYHEDHGWLSDLFILADKVARGMVDTDRLPPDERPPLPHAWGRGARMLERACGWEVLYARPDLPEPPKHPYAME